MPTTSLNQIIPQMQTAIGPVILISGVGLLLLSLTNRFGRAVDRARQLLRDMRAAAGEDRTRLASQVENLYQRAMLIQRAIIFAAMSLLFAALLIITLFFEAVLKIESAVFVGILFVGCLGSLIAALIAFILDIRLSLKALKMELAGGGMGASI